MPSWMLIGALALAKTSGFYHPDDVAAASEAFSRAGEAASHYGELDARSRSISIGLRQWEAALDLLGPRAPESERAHLAEVQERFGREHAVMQAFVDTMVEDFDTEFRAALERALAAHPGDEQECVRQIPVGKPLPGIRVRLQDNPECTGEDLNAALAAKMDADPKLQQAITEILALSWPELTLPSEARPAIGAGERSVSVLGLLEAVAPARLKEIDTADADARLPFEAAIEEGASKEDLAALVEQARAVTEATASARAALAQPVLAAADKALAKRVKKGEPATAWCATPTTLGGCVPPEDPALAAALAADKKVSAAAR